MAQYSLYGPRTTLPFGSFDQLRREMNSLLDRRAGPMAMRSASSGAFPPTNLYETPDAYVLTAELPGVDPSEIQVALQDSTIAIRGERRVDTRNAQGANVHRAERQAGSFRRAFSLPAKVDADKVEAVHKNGVLMLRVPKSPEAQPRQISVKAS